MRRLPIILSLILVSCACVEKPEPDDEGPDNGGLPAAEYGTRVPLQSAVTKVQPMTGLVLWTSSKSKAEYVQLEYSYMLYNQVCKNQDEFNWDAMDKLLAEVAARGHQAVVRFRYTYPGYASAVPDYIKALPGYEARLAFVETGFGHWAEYHVYDGKYIKGQTFPSTEFQKEFLPMMDEWFHDTPWMISIDAADRSYGSPFPSTKSLLDLKFGNFDDSFMCEDWNGYNWKSWSFFGKDRYKTGPAGGEFSYYSSYDQKHCLDAAGMYGRTFEELAAKVHMTFIIAADQPGKQTNERLKEASMATGYRYEIRDFQVKEGVGAAVCIANVGVAPIYRDAFVEVEGVRGDLNLRTLMPGEEAWVTISCPATKASRPTIACDHLVSGQEIQYQADVH